MPDLKACGDCRKVIGCTSADGFISCRHCVREKDCSYRLERCRCSGPISKFRGSYFRVAGDSFQSPSVLTFQQRGFV